MVLSLFYLYESIRGKNASEETWPTGQGLKNVLYVLGCLILYVVLIPYFGFIVTSAIFLFLLLSRHYKWYIGLAVSVGASLFLYYLFEKMLGVMLPQFGF